MTHKAIFSGDGHYCPDCGCSWDQGDTPPAMCGQAAPEMPKLIAFAGRKGTGKDTAAAVLTARGYTNVKMADGLKAMLRGLLAYRGADEALIYRMLEGDLKETPSRLLGGRTTRHAMQSLGDWGREVMDENLWVDATSDRCDQVAGPVVISDVRYPNEGAMVRSRGPLYLIDRETDSVDGHSSETEISNLVVDWVITNDQATAGAFQAHVKEIVGLTEYPLT